MATEIAVGRANRLATQLVAAERVRHDTHEAARAAALAIARATVTILETCEERAPADIWDGVDTGGGVNRRRRGIGS